MSAPVSSFRDLSLF